LAKGLGPALRDLLGDLAVEGGGHGRQHRPDNSISDDTPRLFSIHRRRSSLKERGRVKTLVTSFWGCLRPQRTRRHGRRGQGSGGARPRSGRRALRSAPGSTNNMGGGDSSGGRFLTGEKCFRAVRSSGPGVPAWGAGPGGLPVIPSPRQGRHDGVRGASGRRGQSDGATTPGLGVMTCTTRADQGKAEGGVHAAAGWCSRARTWPSRSA
jgi:hypothetical protein